jgi:cytochrome P450
MVQVRALAANYEILCFVNPVQMVNRYASVDLEIGGVKVPKGSHLMLVNAAANHDPALVGQPEQLDLTHSDPKHLAFGQGIHYCLGAPLARLEGEIAFTTLLKRLPNLRLANPQASLEWRPPSSCAASAPCRLSFNQNWSLFSRGLLLHGSKNKPEQPFYR